MNEIVRVAEPDAPKDTRAGRSLLRPRVVSARASAPREPRVHSRVERAPECVISRAFARTRTMPGAHVVPSIFVVTVSGFAVISLYLVAACAPSASIAVAARPPIKSFFNSTIVVRGRSCVVVGVVVAGASRNVDTGSTDGVSGLQASRKGDCW